VKVFEDGFPAWEKDPQTYTAVEVGWVLDKMNAKAPMTLVDSRPKQTKFDKGHIPGAINIPDSQFDNLKGQLPKDKNADLVFYCEGYT